MQITRKKITAATRNIRTMGSWYGYQAAEWIYYADGREICHWESKRGLSLVTSEGNQDIAKIRTPRTKRSGAVDMDDVQNLVAQLAEREEIISAREALRRAGQIA